MLLTSWLKQRFIKFLTPLALLAPLHAEFLLQCFDLLAEGLVDVADCLLGCAEFIVDRDDGLLYVAEVIVNSIASPWSLLPLCKGKGCASKATSLSSACAPQKLARSETATLANRAYDMSGEAAS